MNFYQTFDYIRSFTPKPVSAIESIVCSIAKNSVDMRPGMIVVFSENGKTARLIAKYRPCAPVLLVTSNDKLARACSSLYAVEVGSGKGQMNMTGWLKDSVHEDRLLTLNSCFYMS